MANPELEARINRAAVEYVEAQGALRSRKLAELLGLVEQLLVRNEQGVRIWDHFYSEEVFAEALNNSVGLGFTEAGNRSQKIYDPARGLYTHYLMAELRFSGMEHKRLGHSDTVELNEELDGEEIVERSELPGGAYLVRLADLVRDCSFLKKDLHRRILQLAYTLWLINYSRWQEECSVPPTVRRKSRYLCETAERAFIDFATTLKGAEPFPLQALLRAALSDTVMENKLYKTREGKDLLADRAVAWHLGAAESTVCAHLKNLKEKLFNPVVIG